MYIYVTERKRHFLSSYFCVNPFELPCCSYDIRRELIDKPSIISYFPSTLFPNLGHHQGRTYYKSYVTFECTFQLCKKSVCTVILCSVLKCCYIYEFDLRLRHLTCLPTLMGSDTRKQSICGLYIYI